MSLGLQQILPNINAGLSKIGFFFGAGTSKEAGYPLTDDLTKIIFKNMDSNEKNLLEGILQREEMDYNFEEGTPDIEEISDIIYRNKNSSPSTDINNLEQSIKNKIFQAFIPHSHINLEYHIKFLKALKALMTNKAEPIWIFTTNYDLLFEMAAMQARIPIYNGFEGILNRYFAPERLNLRYGTITGIHFNEFKEPHIKILKLHGSISWYKRGEDICESYENNPSLSENCSMILPRRVKTLDALEHPYDKIFRHTLQCLGRDCQYLVSCGYSFRDEHINDTIIIPKLREGKIRITAFFKNEPPIVEKLREFRNFNFVTESKSRLNGNEISNDCNTWKFNELAKLFIEKAGIG